jgi:hypothetical protein
MATVNTTDPKPGFVYNADDDTWYPLVGIAPGTSVDRWSKTATGSETSVNGTGDTGSVLSYSPGTEQVYLNGVLLVRSVDYTASNGTSITGLTALAADDILEVITFNPSNIQITDGILKTEINAKGDLIVGLSDNTPGILTKGTDGLFLKANSSQTSGLEWAAAAPSSTAVSSNITLAANSKYFVDTTVARTLTLPASPSLGNEIQIFDATGTAGTYNITVASNSLKINGSVQDATLDVNGVAAVFVYTGSTYGWRMG